MAEKNMPVIEFEFDLPVIRKIQRQPSKLEIDYELLSRLCCIGSSMSACAFALGTTSAALDLKIRKDLKMTFNEFQGYYESYLETGIRQKLVEKALIEGHFPSLQWLSINVMGMSKDGMMKKKEGSDMGEYTTEELIQMLKGGSDGTSTKTKSIEQREGTIKSGAVHGRPGNFNTRSDTNTDKGSASPGRSAEGKGKTKK